MASYGLPNSNDIATIASYLEQYVLSYRSTLGADPYDGGASACARAQQALEGIIGNGTLAGISVSELQRQLIQPLGRLVWQSRYIDWTAMQLQPIITAADNVVAACLPAEWQPTGRALDWWLTRCNATASEVPSPPAQPTLVATLGGAISQCTAANAPAVYITHVVGAYESTASPAASGVALSGPYGSYTVSIAGTVPAGVTHVRVYRTRVGQPTGEACYVGQWSATAGSAYPTIVLDGNDAVLRPDVQPPSYASMLVSVGFGLLYGIALSAGGVLSDAVMMSPTNCYAVAASGWTDLYGAAAPMILAQRVIGTVWASGSYSTTNDAEAGIQGVLGAKALRVRVTSTLNTGASVTNIQYGYVSPSGSGVDTVAGPIALAAASGSTASVPIPAGRIVTAVLADTCSSATSGTYIYEAAA